MQALAIDWIGIQKRKRMAGHNDAQLPSRPSRAVALSISYRVVSLFALWKRSGPISFLALTPADGHR